MQGQFYGTNTISMRRILFKLLFFYASLAAAQQPGITLSGSVFSNNKAMAAASVSLHDSTGKTLKGTITNDTGRFEMKVTAGKYTITATNTGFTEVHTDNFIITGNSDTTLATILLQPSVGNMKEVTVTGAKKLFEMKADKMIMNVENSVLATGNSVFEVVRKAPAVTVDKDDNLKLKGAVAQIFIDGKPAYLSGTQLTEYLKNLPADAVATIEIISNPSSRYDAAGLSGIINIRLKKNKMYGLNGMANADVGYGKYPKANAGVNLNYREGKVNIFGNGYTGYSESFNKLTYNSVIRQNNSATYQDRDNYWNPVSNWSIFKAGMDYNAGKKTVIGILVNGDFEKTDARTDNSTVFSNADRQPYQSIKSVRKDKIALRNTSYNLNLKTTLDTLGSEFSADIDYAHYNRASEDVNENAFYAANGNELRNPYVFRNIQPATVDIYAVKMDYTGYISQKVKLEAGAKASRVKTDNNLIADTLADAHWNKDFTRSNHFIYQENILAVYATISAEVGKTSFQAGLRGEQTISEATMVTLDRIDKRSYFNLFPTLFITRKLDDKHDLSFSYSRRIQRPGYQSLNPFVMYIDPYTSFQGNPYLKPSFSNSLELKHSYKQFLFTALSYRDATDVMTNVIRQDAATGKVVNAGENAGREANLRLDITASIPVKKWWAMEYNVGIAWYNGVSDLPGFSYNTTAFAADFSSSHTFSLPKSFKIQTDLYYSAPTTQGLAKMRSAYGWSLGIQKQLWNNRATLKLNGSNILGTNAYRAHYLGEGLDIRWKNQWEGRRVTLGFVFKFGSQQVKAARNRNTGTQEERNRVSL